MDEQLLIDGCKRGEALARKELYELYAPAMMSVCVRYVRDRETARDLLQDGFVKIFMDLSKYSPKYRPIRRQVRLAPGYEEFL